MPSPGPEPGRHYPIFWGRVESFKYAGQGVAYMLRHERNAWVHAAITAAVIAAGFLFGISGGEWCWLILAMASVWTAESFNTALEIIVDIASPEWRPAAGRAKDVAAGAVLLCAVGAAAIGLIIFLPHAFRLLHGV